MGVWWEVLGEVSGRCLSNASPSVTPVFIGFPDEKGRWGGVIANVGKNLGMNPFSKKNKRFSFPFQKNLLYLQSKPMYTSRQACCRKFQNELNGKDNDSRPKWAMSLPFLIDIIRSFSNLALPPHQMAKGAEEFLSLLDNTQEYGHGFDVELPGLNVMNDAFAIIGK